MVNFRAGNTTASGGHWMMVKDGNSAWLLGRCGRWFCSYFLKNHNGGTAADPQHSRARFFQVICMQHGAISKDSPSGRACPPGSDEDRRSQFQQVFAATLAFGRQFNQSLDAVSLPSSLESLTFGINFNHTLKGVNLQDLVVGL